ncbi:hypothetical protein [Chryseobacterium sp. OV279]|uniref:hypothetical protein n=1 Tax=Chryseobacterium sp. OV279 TaxID=1500285 RepID=UPI00091E83AE|nr:hypothetical protein [Chryseobacterium sp. OV279]SHG65347.1 hypothetical protein SAMN02787100_4434 [Chryseobacterium sp. OV279]
MLKKIFDFFRENGPVEEITVVPVPQESTLHFVENMNVSESSDIKPYLRKSSEASEKINNLEEHIKTYKEYCLEKTSNQHTLKAPGYKIIEKDGSTETFRIYGDGFIFHGEHKILRIESDHFVKYIQQEYNPITQLTENAYD